MKTITSWILCQQNNLNIVEFITSNMTETSSLFYNDFLEYIKKFKIFEFSLFLEQLNTFKVLKIDFNTTLWEEFDTKNNENVTFNQLKDLNPDKVMKKETNQDNYLNPSENNIQKIKELNFKRMQRLKKNKNYNITTFNPYAKN